MSLNLLRSLIALEQNHELHMARLLLLIAIISGRPNGPKINGITKLVKLDFLLRYPTALERALSYLRRPTSDVNIQDHERDSVESTMIRFKYGPWDPRYRNFLAIMQAKGLLNVTGSDKLVEIEITEKGYNFADQLIRQGDFKDYVSRSKIIKTHFGGLGATRLKDLMYELMPELKEMELGETISP